MVWTKLQESKFIDAICLTESENIIIRAAVIAVQITFATFLVKLLKSNKPIFLKPVDSPTSILLQDENKMFACLKNTARWGWCFIAEFVTKNEEGTSKYSLHFERILSLQIYAWRRMNNIIYGKAQTLQSKAQVYSKIWICCNIKSLHWYWIFLFTWTIALLIKFRR